MEHLEDILNECATLQTVCGGLGHRVVLRFGEFVNAAMFGGVNPGVNPETKIYEKYRDRTESRFNGGAQEFMMWGKLYLEYCKEEFKV